MKKLLIMTLIAAVAFSSAACKAAPASGANIVPDASKPVQTEQQPPEQQDKTTYEGPMKLAYEGKINGEQFSVGSKLKDIVDALGQPEVLENFEGTSYISYGNVSFMLDRIIDSTGDSALVNGIIVSDAYELYGVKIGMTSSEIKQVLGAAQQEYMEGEGEDSIWKLEYNCGDYMLTFYFDDNKAPSTSAYLNKVQP